MTIQSVSKAIAGALVTALVTWLAQRGVVIEAQYSDAVTLLLAAVIGFVAVYLAPKNK